MEARRESRYFQEISFGLPRKTHPVRCLDSAAIKSSAWSRQFEPDAERPNLWLRVGKPKENVASTLACMDVDKQAFSLPFLIPVALPDAHDFATPGFHTSYERLNLEQARKCRRLDRKKSAVLAHRDYESSPN